MVVPGTIAYASSKFALEAFSDGLRRELLPYGVSVSVIEPAYVQSDIHGKWNLKDAVLTKAKEVYPYLLSAEKEAQHLRCVEKAAPATVTSMAIHSALSDVYPQTR